jgi:uncharacterized protein (TIGR02421 family)
MPDLDAMVVRAARRIRILSTLSWPAAVEVRFLDRWRAGQPELPAPPPVVSSVDDGDLAQVVAKADMQDPQEAFVARTADGYRRALAMLASAGTPDFSRHSRALYGGPDTPTAPGGPTARDEAEHLLRATATIGAGHRERTLTDEQARDHLQAAVDRFFPDLPVVLDPDLVSLAAAGSKRIRLRGGRRWAPGHLDQLLQHEALVHSATKRNGRGQPLGTLGLSSPRTTAVQEGLATLAELVTGSLDVRRLRRIALRVRMVDLASSGADFIEVFQSLLDLGQDETEAFRTAMRVFRGGDVRGGVAFTKDVVYLSGLRQVHSFMLAALRAQRADLPAVLFAGRMTCGDALALAPLVADGTLRPAAVLTPWVANTDRLAAYLAWAAFGQGVAPVALDAFD